MCPCSDFPLAFSVQDRDSDGGFGDTQATAALGGGAAPGHGRYEASGLTGEARASARRSGSARARSGRWRRRLANGDAGVGGTAVFVVLGGSPARRRWDPSAPLFVPLRACRPRCGSRLRSGASGRASRRRTCGARSTAYHADRHLRQNRQCPRPPRRWARRCRPDPARAALVPPRPL